MTFSPQTRLLVAGAVQLQAWALTDGGVSVRVGHREAVSWAGCIEALQEVGFADRHVGFGPRVVARAGPQATIFWTSERWVKRG